MGKFANSVVRKLATVCFVTLWAKAVAWNEPDDSAPLLPPDVRRAGEPDELPPDVRSCALDSALSEDSLSGLLVPLQSGRNTDSLVLGVLQFDK